MATEAHGLSDDKAASTRWWRLAILCFSVVAAL